MAAVTHAAALVYSPHPILPAADRRIVVEPVRAGESIAEYLDRIGLRIGARPVRLTVAGHEVPRAMWSRTRPRPGVTMHVQAIAEGGGDGGSNPLRTVLQIAVLAASFYFGPALGAALGVSSAAGSAIISIGGALLVNALLPAPRLRNKTGSDNASPSYALAGGSNRTRPYEPLPLVIGRHRMYPDLGAQPYTEAIGADQYLCQLFQCGPGLLALSEFRIGDTLLSDFAGVELQVSGMDGALSLFPGNVDTIAGADLTAAAGWVTRSTPSDTTRIAVEVAYVLVSTDKEGKTQSLSCQIEAQYRAPGGAWVGLASGTETRLHDAYWSAGYTDPESGWVQVAYGSTDPAEHVAGSVYAPAALQTHPVWYYLFAGEEVTTPQATWRWRPYAEVSPLHPAPTPPREYTVTVSAVTISGRSQSVQRLTLALDVPAGVYDVRVRRVTADSTSEREVSQTALSQIRCYQRDGTSYAGQQRVALRIKASGQLNGTVQQFSCIASASALVWTGSAWAWQPTSNPAWWYLYVALGWRDSAGRRIYGAGLAWERIDIETIKAWAAFCDAAGLRFDAIVDQSMTCAELLMTIARAGRATPTWQAGVLGAIWDAPAQPAVAIVGMGQIIAGSFRVEYAGGELADEIACEYVDAGANWQQQTVRALMPGVTSPRRSSTVQLVGITSREQAQREANLLAAAQYYRRRTVTWDADLEGMVYQRGDVVQLSHDLTQWGYSGRVVSGRYNLVRWSEDLSRPEWVGYWQKPAITAGVTDPFGGTSACRLASADKPAAPGQYYSGVAIVSPDALPAGTYEVSLYARCVSGTLGIGYGMADGLTVVAMLSTTWQRYAVTVTTAARAAGLTVFEVFEATPGNSAWEIFAPQVIAGSVSRPYQPTGADAITLDRQVPRGAGDYVLLRWPDGRSATIACAPGSGDTDTLTLAAAIPTSDGEGALPAIGSDGPAWDWVWLFGPQATPGKRVKVTSVAPSADGRIRITATDEEPQYYSAEYDLGNATPAPPATLRVGSVRDLRIAEAVIPRSGGRVRVSLSWGLQQALSALVEVSRDGVPLLSTEQTATTAALEVDEGDRISVSVRPVPYGAGQTLAYSVIGRLAVPADVTGLALEQIEGTLHLSWDAVPDLDLIGYRVRYSPATSGATWADAQDVGTVSGGTRISLPARAGSYLVKAVDEIGQESTFAAIIATTLPTLYGLNLVATVDEAATGFAGTKSAVAAVDGGLVLDTTLLFDAGGDAFGADLLMIDAVPGQIDDGAGSWDDGGASPDAALGLFDAGFGSVAESGTYLFAEAVDLGGIYVSRVTAALSMATLDYANTVDSAPGLWDDRGGDVDGGDAAIASAWIESRSSLDGSAWTPWAVLTAADVRARHHQFRAQLTSASRWASPRVTAMSVTVDMADRVDSGSVTTSAGGATDVAFDPPFADVPRLGISASGLASGDYYTLTGPDRSGFSIRFFDAADAGVARSLGWVAHGYGAED